MKHSTDHKGAEKPRVVKLWSNDFILTLGIALFAFISCQALNNGTPLYIERIGGTTGFSGTLIFVFSLSAAAARLLVGKMIDAWSRRSIMVIGSILMFCGTALALPFPGMAPQIALRALQGVGFACITTASSTAAADVLPYQRLGEGIGYYSLGQSLGMAVGPTLGIFLCSLIYPESLFAGCAILGITLFVLTWNCTYEKHIERLPETSEYRLAKEAESRSTTTPLAPHSSPISEKQGIRHIVTPENLRGIFEKRALVGAIPMFCVCFAFSIPTSYTALFAQNLGFEHAGIFFLIGAITMTISRLCGGRLLDSVAPRTLFTLVCVCGIAMFAMMGLTSSALMFYASGFFFGISLGFALPLLNSIAIKNTPASRWGAANALIFLANDLGVGLGALTWGFVSDSFGIFAVMLGGSFTFAASYIIALLTFSIAGK